MKKVLTIILLLLTISLMSGWKWELMETGQGPPVHDGPEDDTHDFHAAYDPAIQKLVLTFWHNAENRSEIWLFDGENWRFECETNDGNEYTFATGSLVFDTANQKLIDIQELASFPTPPNSRFCAVDQLKCFDCFLQFQPVAVQGTYDSGRSVLVMQKTSYPEGIIEYDGSQIVVKNFTLVGNAEYMEYDPNISKTVLYSRNSEKTMLYDGKSVEYLDNELSLSGTALDMAYFPKLKGIVLSYLNHGNYLFRNGEWTKLGYNKNDLPIYLVGGLSRAIIYYPPRETLLLIAYHSTGNIVIYEFVNAGHIRPFNGP